MASAPLQATIHELRTFFDLSTPQQLRTYSQVVARTVLDRCTLYTLVDRTADRTQGLVYAGIHWMAVEMPPLVKNRDTCYIEAVYEFDFCDPKTQDRRRGLVRTMHSIELRHCPPLEASHKLVRATLLRSGHVFLEASEPDVWTHHLVYVTVPHGNLPKFLNTKFCDHSLENMLNLDEHLCLERWKTKIDARLFVAQRSPTTSGTACGICTRRFKAWSSQGYCRSCGKHVCVHCSHKWRIQLPYRVYPLLLCLDCFHGSPPPKPADADPDATPPDYSRSTWTSSDEPVTPASSCGAQSRSGYSVDGSDASDSGGWAPVQPVNTPREALGRVRFKSADFPVRFVFRR